MIQSSQCIPTITPRTVHSRRLSPIVQNFNSLGSVRKGREKKLCLRSIRHTAVVLRCVRDTVSGSIPEIEIDEKENELGIGGDSTDFEASQMDDSVGDGSWEELESAVDEDDDVDVDVDDDVDADLADDDVDDDESGVDIYGDDLFEDSADDLEGSVDGTLDDVEEELDDLESDAEDTPQSDYIGQGGSPEVEELIAEGGENLSFQRVKQIFSYRLDKFQKASVEELLTGNSVVVCAPTGAGKTAIAEAATAACLAQGKQVVYTTPLKALSNQKLFEFRERFGYTRVGLSTGDITIRNDAPVVVMTTEILRNIVYDNEMTEEGELIGVQRLKNVGLIVLDEVHYLRDPYRGSTWEELIIRCPTHIQMLCMSATVANPNDLGDWITQIHGQCSTVRTNKRPVPLRWFFGFKGKNKTEIAPLMSQKTGRVTKHCIPPSRRRQDLQDRVPNLVSLVRELEKGEFLPAIVFEFSRKGCDDKAALMAEGGLCLTDPTEQATIAERVDSLREEEPETVREHLTAALVSGIASHHAGCLPAWKALIEDLFQRGLLKLVFATETLAAGINMPARTTVISKLSRRRRDSIVMLSYNELLQMAGRAGRRGFDTIGNCVILQSPWEGAIDAAQILRRGPEPLESQFTTGYSLVVNLLRIYSLDEARTFLERSFRHYMGGRGLSRREEEIRLLKKEAKDFLNEAREIAGNSENKTLKQYEDAKKRLGKEREKLEALVATAQAERTAIVLEALFNTEPPIPVIIDPSRRGMGKSEGIAALALSAKSLNGKQDDLSGVSESNNGAGEVNGNSKEVPKCIVTCLGADNQFYRVHAKNIVGTWKGEYKPVDGMKDLLDVADGLSTSWTQVNGHVERNEGTLATAKLAFKIPALHEIQQLSWSPESETKILQQVKRTRKIKRKVADVAKEQEKASNESSKVQIQLSRAEKKLNEAQRMKRLLERQQQQSWKSFQGIVEILKQAGAVDENTLALLPLGDVVREIHGENELWLAMAFTHPSVLDLDPPNLASFVCALIAAECASRPEMTVAYEPSEEVLKVIEGLEDVRRQIFEWETASGMAPSTGLEVDPRLAGIVEGWAAGCTWQQIMDGTSLDDGDIARLLMRTQDLLRQIKLSQHLLPTLRDTARKAYRAMNRKPIRDITR